MHVFLGFFWCCHPFFFINFVYFLFCLAMLVFHISLWYTIICESFELKYFSSCAKCCKVFTSNTIYSDIWHTLIWAKILSHENLSTKNLQMKLMQTTVFTCVIFEIPDTGRRLRRLQCLYSDEEQSCSWSWHCRGASQIVKTSMLIYVHWWVLIIGQYSTRNRNTVTSQKMPLVDAPCIRGTVQITKVAVVSTAIEGLR